MITPGIYRRNREGRQGTDVGTRLSGMARIGFDGTGLQTGVKVTGLETGATKLNAIERNHCSVHDVSKRFAEQRPAAGLMTP